jgi:hypothetical protein
MRRFPEVTMRATLALFTPLLLVLAACGGSGGAPTPAAAPPAAATTTAAAPAVATAIADPLPKGEWAIAGGAGAKAVANVGSNANNATVTRLLVADAVGDATRGIHYIDGAWQLPVPVGGAAPEGLAWNAGRAVLASTDIPSRFVTLPLDTDKTRPSVIDLSKDGSFTFDALSTDGKLLYLAQAADSSGKPVDKIRAYDIARGSLFPDPVVDKAGGSEAMSGVAVARVRSKDGSGVYTVYEGAEHPFVHALLTDMQISICIDLPATPAPGATDGWTIELSDNGRVLTATSDRLKKAFVMDVTDNFPTLRGAGAPAS